MASRAHYIKNRDKVIAKSREYYAKNRERILAMWRARPKHPKRRVWSRAETSYKYILKKVYGLSPWDYDALLDKQGWACAVCHKYETVKDKSGNVQMLSVDHDHKTGEVRGLLCRACNGMLGLAKDCVSTLASGAAYLKASGGVPSVST